MLYQTDEELKKAVKNRIMMINSDMQNNLYALSFDDNFDQEEIDQYYENNNMAINFQQNMNELSVTLSDFETDTESTIGIIDDQIVLKVKQGDAVSQLNAESGNLIFRSKQFLVDTPNFKVNADGCYVNGKVTASRGTLGDWTFQNGTASGSARTIMTGGIIEARTATCSFVNADIYDLNPNHATNYHNVNFDNSLWQVGDTNRKRTIFDGDVISYGAIELDGKLEVYDDVHCTRLRLTNSEGNYGTNSIIYCTEIVTRDYTWSDERIKKNIMPITDEEALKINELRPVSFRFVQKDIPAAGLIAQDAMKVFDGSGCDSIIDEQKGYYGINYKQLIPLMIRQIQNNISKLERGRNG